MIVVEERGELRLVTQPDHARFAAQLLELWHHRELRLHPRRRPLLAAVREHDNGWRETDAAPRIEPSTGRLYDFRALPGEARRELWRRGVERFADSRPYVALLAAQHARGLHRDRRRDPEWATFLGWLDERRGQLLEAAGLAEAALADDYSWLELADALSLAVCCQSDEPVVRGDLTGRASGDELEITPFPLAGATTFEIPCRWIADRRYRGEKDLAGALGTARWQRFRVRCRPSSARRPPRR